MLRHYFWPVIITVSILLTGVAGNSDAGILRAIITTWFLLICPGMAFVKLLRIEEQAIELVIALAVSIAMSTLVSEAMALANIWMPRIALVVLMGISGVGVMLQVITAPRN